MTYYAVTNDPNELAHFGIKGMKWGVRRTDAQLGHPRHTGSRKPRSVAYKKAQNKLGISMKNGIKRVEARWQEYNSPKNKAIRAAKRYDRQTERAIQKARKGKLKYKKLDDWQVQRITERLAMERNARQLSETERGFGSRLKKSIGEGVVSGIGQGFGRRASEWIARGSILKTDRKRMEQQNRMELEKQRKHQMQEIALEKATAKQRARNKVNEEYYEEAARRGYSPTMGYLKAGHVPRIQTNGSRAKQLAAWNERNEEAELRKSYNNAYQKTYAVKRAEELAKLNIPSSSSSEPKSSKDKGPGASQSPIAINIYGNRHGYGVSRSGGSDIAPSYHSGRRRRKGDRN